MDFKVIFRDSFLEDLESLLRLIAAENPAAANKLGNKIVAKADELRFFPERYPRVRQRRNVRRFIVQRYFKVFYSIGQEARTVDILRCWDGRRGLMQQRMSSDAIMTVGGLGKRRS